MTSECMWLHLLEVLGSGLGVAQVLFMSLTLVPNLLLHLLSLLFEVWNLKIHIAYEGVASLCQMYVCREQPECGQRARG